MNGNEGEDGFVEILGILKTPLGLAFLYIKMLAEVLILHLKTIILLTFLDWHKFNEL